MNESRQYLGDGVFVATEGYGQAAMVKLTTSDGFSDRNTIWLEAYVLKALRDYLDKTWGPND